MQRPSDSFINYAKRKCLNNFYLIGTNNRKTRHYSTKSANSCKIILCSLITIGSNTCDNILTALLPIVVQMNAFINNDCARNQTSRKCTMAGKEGDSILQELYAAVTLYEFSDYINYIVPRDAMPLHVFQQSALSEDYYADTTFCFNHSCVNEDMLFELFRSFSNDDTITVHANMITEVKTYKDWHEHAAFILNIMKSLSIDSWLNIMKYKGIKGDEISLHALGRIYQCHIMVHTKTKPWTTVKIDKNITEDKLHEICNVHLLFLGNDVYARLLKKLCLRPGEQDFEMNQFSQHPPKSIKSLPQTAKTGFKPTSTAMTGTVIDDTEHETSGTNSRPTTSHTLGFKPAPTTTASNNIEDTTCKTSGTNSLQTPSIMTGANQVESPHTYIPMYGPPIFPTAIQILPLHPHFSEDESRDPSNGEEDNPTNSSIEPNVIEETPPQDSQNIVVSVADVINRECCIKLDRLNEDEINAWTAKQTVPEFPNFVKGREVGGYMMRPQPKPVHPRYNTHPKRNRPVYSYANLDESDDKQDSWDDKKHTNKK